MSRVRIRLEALRHNLRVVDEWMEKHGATWTLVSKVLCGHPQVLAELRRLGVHSFGESRLENLAPLREGDDQPEIWYLRGPDRDNYRDVVENCEVSLNSELRVIRALDRHAGEVGKRHCIVIMVELGDLREGILPGTLVEFYEQVLAMEHVDVLGIGSNLGCMFGAVPTVEQMAQLDLYRELLELKFERAIPLISAGSTSTLPMLIEGQMPKAINHFRIGEAVFLGSDLVRGGTLPGLRNDVVELESHVLEVKEKSLVPVVQTSESVQTFEMEVEEGAQPGQRGYRALVGIGNLDTDVGGLTPIESGHQIAGASSDLTVLNVGDEAGTLRVGDTVRFRPNYSAFLRAMNSRYMRKEVVVVPAGHYGGDLAESTHSVS